MKNIFNLFLFLNCFLSVSAQNKLVLKLGEKQDINKVIPISGNDGFLLIINKAFLQSSNQIKLHFINKDLTKRWEVNIDKEGNKYKNNNYYVVTSSLSKYTYYFPHVFLNTSSILTLGLYTKDSEKKKRPLDNNYNEDNVYNSYIQNAKKNSMSWGLGQSAKNLVKDLSFNLIRVDSTGKVEKFKINQTKEFVQEINIAKLAHENGLVFITSDDSKIKGTKERKLVVKIYTLDDGENEIIEKNGALIEIEYDKDSQMPTIEYLGVDSEFIYLAHKKVIYNLNTITYQIYKVNKNSYSVSDQMEISLQPEKEFVPAVNLRLRTGDIKFYSDYDIHTYTTNVATSQGNRTQVNVVITPTEGAFGCAKLDVNNGKFYIYGLTTASKFKSNVSKSGKINANYKVTRKSAAVYVATYDFQTANRLSYQTYNFNEELAKKNSKYDFVYKNIWLEVLNSDLLRMGISNNWERGITHIITFNNSNKADYQVFKYKNGNSGPNNDRHIYFYSNLLVSKYYADKNILKFYNSFNGKLRTKQYAMSAFYMYDKMYFIKNESYTKQPKITITDFKLGSVSQ